MDQVVIGLWGPAGVGKDATADALGWPKASFASRLKSILRPVFDAAGVDINNREQKEKVRPIMVATGSCLRSIDPFYWIKNVELPAGKRAVICDVRYLNEIQYVWSRGGTVYEIVRPGFEPANEEERRSFGEIRQMMTNLGVSIPQIVNTTPQAAAEAILADLFTRGQALWGCND
jgi:hypothetical protein